MHQASWQDLRCLSLLRDVSMAIGIGSSNSGSDLISAQVHRNHPSRGHLYVADHTAFTWSPPCSLSTASRPSLASSTR